jgi:hypothetical protein
MSCDHIHGAQAVPLAPYQYELVYALLYEPLTAGELASILRWRWVFTAQGVASRLRPLVKRGWVERSETGIYRATDRARQAVCW